MPGEHGKGVVRSIFRRGDRVLVELESGLYVLVIQSSEIIDGELWLYGAGPGSIKTFQAECIVRRLAPGERFTWPE
jgi:hypothetical protein